MKVDSKKYKKIYKIDAVEDDENDRSYICISSQDTDEDDFEKILIPTSIDFTEEWFEDFFKENNLDLKIKN